MHWGIEMRIKSSISIEGPMTQIALPTTAVECTRGSGVSEVVILMPFNLLLGDDALPITLTNHTEYRISIKRRSMSA